MKPGKRVSGGGKSATRKMAGRAARATKKAGKGKIGRGRGVGGRRVKDRGVKVRIGSLKASEEGTEGKSFVGLRAGLRAWRGENKKRITLFLDADVLAWFKEKPKYQKEINRALREVMRSGGNQFQG